MLLGAFGAIHDDSKLNGVAHPHSFFKVIFCLYPSRSKENH